MIFAFLFYPRTLSAPPSPSKKRVMAISLRSVSGVEKTDRVGAMLNHLFTPGVIVKRERVPSNGANPRSEYDAYHEREMWTKMKTERDKDLVLMFGDDDVRIFKRNQPTAQASKQRLQRAGVALTKADLVDTSGLVPVAMDAHVSKLLLSPDFAPWSKEERDRIQQRRQEAMLRRQQLQNQYVYVSSAQQDKAQSTHLSQYQQQLIDFGVQLPTNPSTGEEPAYIPPKAWQSWISRGMDERKLKEDRDASSALRRGATRQRRHHRINCVYHPFSTNAEMRKLAIQTSFPSSLMQESKVRLLHAANGSRNGEGHRFDLQACFGRVDVLSRPSSHENSASSPSISALPLKVNTDSDLSQFDRCSPNSGSAQQARVPSTQETFMTESRCHSAIEKCRLPELDVFDLPRRPHSLSGEFVDCDCTPRLTDDEMGILGLRDNTSTDKRNSSFLGSAARAEKRVELWHRDFIVSNVRARRALQSRVDEREERRSFVINEREHLNFVTSEAEKTGADYHISRSNRCTTPAKGSMWDQVMDAIGDDRRHIMKNLDNYIGFCDFCSKLTHAFGVERDEEGINLIL